jgi:hypothetical protein
VYRHEINEKAKTLKLWIRRKRGYRKCRSCRAAGGLKTPFGEACESAAARPVARRFGLPTSTVRAIDLRYLERWAAARDWS